MNDESDAVQGGDLRFDISVPGHGWWLASSQRREQLGVEFLAYGPTEAPWFESNIVAALDPRPSGVPMDDLANEYAIQGSAGAEALRVVRRETVGESLTQLVEFPASDPDTGAAHLLQQLQTLIAIDDTSGGPGAIVMVSLTTPPDELRGNLEAFQECVASVKVTAGD